MDKERIIEIVSNPQDRSNKDLNECLSFLNDEFEKTKSLIISLTKHLDGVEGSYNTINDEINKRYTKV